MKIVIRLSSIKFEDKKHVINSIRGFVKALAKRHGFEFQFDRESEE